MKLVNYKQVQSEPVEEAPGVTIRWLITEADGAGKFIMRHFTLAPGASTPYHDHRWEHEVFVLEGEGMVKSATGENPVGPGDVVFMPGGEKHCFRNVGNAPLTFLCLIPAREDKL